MFDIHATTAQATGARLPRRGFAKLAAAGLLSVAVGAAWLGQADAREPEPGDDRRHGNGREDHHHHHHHEDHHHHGGHHR